MPAYEYLLARAERELDRTTLALWVSVATNLGMLTWALSP